jgi:sporulation protein YlmC with PRC-barrel domain
MTDYTASAAGDISKTETTSLIAASKVEGTAVYGAQGEHVGKIYDVMLDKTSGQVAYAVLSFGGFLGIGSDYYPLPWNALAYSERHGGYVSNVDKSLLEGAPKYAAGDDGRWNEPAYARGIDDYYSTSISRTR